MQVQNNAFSIDRDELKLAVKSRWLLNAVAA